MSIPRSGRARRSAVAALPAVAVPLTAATAASAAPSAAAKLATAAKRSPNKSVTAIVQFKTSVSEAKAKQIAKPTGARSRPSSRPSAGSPSSSRPSAPAPEDGQGRPERHAQHQGPHDRRLARAAGHQLPEDHRRRQGLGPGHHGQGRRRRDHRLRHQRRIADFKNADGTLARDDNVDLQPGGASPRVTRSATARTSRASSPATRLPRPTARWPASTPASPPRPNIVAIKTADEYGNSTVLDVYQRRCSSSSTAKTSYNIRVVNLSVSSDNAGLVPIDPLDAAVEFAWHRPASSS